MADFNLSIKDWYRQNKRDLPWRHTKDPFHIWLSEIILQQTRVDQGLSYYNKFTDTFKSVGELADADEQTVLNLWQGLGYYSRARNLHAAAKYVQHELNGVFPHNYKDLLELKGVGQYTAAAIASFAFKEPVAVVDGNVFRVLSRYFDIDLPIDSNQGKNYFQQLAQELIDDAEPDLFNQAIMEFGAIQCTPLNPSCETCPLSDSCLALKNNTIKDRPVKSKKTAVRDRFFHYLIFEENGSTVLVKRTEKDIWQNLWQFPLIETSNSDEKPDLAEFKHLPIVRVSDEITHVLSHQRIKTRFYHFSGIPEQPNDGWITVNYTDIQDYPLPRLIDRYLNENK
jgi:A/G-specific adenine glycosylase